MKRSRFNYQLQIPSLITWGELRIPSGLAGILNAASAFFGVLVAAAVFADERLSLRRLIGILLGFAGVALAIGLDVLRGLDLTSLSQLAAAGMGTALSVVMIPLALWQEGWPDFHLSLTTLGGLGYLSVAATALAYLLYYRVIFGHRFATPRGSKANGTWNAVHLGSRLAQCGAQTDPAFRHVRAGENPYLEPVARYRRMVPLLHRLPHRHPLHGRADRG